MRVHVTDLSDRDRDPPFTDDLMTVCGDDTDMYTEVAAEIEATGECVIGGGAAPAYRIVRADH